MSIRYHPYGAWSRGSEINNYLKLLDKKQFWLLAGATILVISLFPQVPKVNSIRISQGAEIANLSTPRKILRGELLDLNRATRVDLIALPGIGPVLAGRIVEYRSRLGPFRTVKALIEVKGIGPVKLKRLTSLVVVSSVTEE